MTGSTMSSSSSSSSLLLPWNNINILVLTDVHSWIAGHGEHPAEHLNVDYGDVLSFYQRIRQQQQQHDALQQSSSSLFFVMNGDFMDGTGLSTIPPQHLTPLLQEMPWDAVNVGNHELYFDATVQHLVKRGFIDHWNGTYLSSNTLLAATQQPMGNRYYFLHDKKDNGDGVTMLTFGFLYNFQGYCASTLVEKVEDVVEQPWFRQVLQHPPEPYQAILVLAHMDCVDPLVSVILHAIRNYAGPTVPVLFVTGHSHRRAFAQLDDHAASFEAGRFLDTVGWVSFSLPPPPPKEKLPPPSAAAASPEATNFEYRFLDANKETLFNTIGATSPSDFETPDGLALTRKIHETQHELGLHRILGCSPHTYYLEGGFRNVSSLHHNKHRSLWQLYTNEIIPQQLLQRVDTRKEDPTLRSIFIQGMGAFRYSLQSGKITVDDVIAVCPFNDKIYEFDYPVSGHQLLEVLQNLEMMFSKFSMQAFATVPTSIEASEMYQVLVPDFEYKRISPFIDNVTQQHWQRHKTPRQVCFGNNKKCLYTLDLWLNHVKEEMPCLMQDQEIENQAAMYSFKGLLPPKLVDGTFNYYSSMSSFALLIGIVLLWMVTRFSKKQHSTENSLHFEVAPDEMDELLSPARLENQCYGSTPTIDNLSCTFSQTSFNKSASSIVRALGNYEGILDNSWRLCHWELQDVDGCSNLCYLYHPPIEIEVQHQIIRNEIGLSQEWDMEDPHVITEDADVEFPCKDKCLMQWSFSIVYSDTYCMPVLYFHVQDISGAPCGRQQVLDILMKQQGQSSHIQDTWDFVSQEQHPVTNLPSFFLHPCQSSARLKLLFIGATTMTKDQVKMDALWTWMSLILPAVGHPIPPSAFLKIQEKLYLL